MSDETTKNEGRQEEQLATELNEHTQKGSIVRDIIYHNPLASDEKTLPLYSSKEVDTNPYRHKLLASFDRRERVAKVSNVWGEATNSDGSLLAYISSARNDGFLVMIDLHSKNFDVLVNQELVYDTKGLSVNATASCAFSSISGEPLLAIGKGYSVRLCSWPIDEKPSNENFYVFRIIEAENIHTKEITGVAFSAPFRKFLFAASRDGSLSMWRIYNNFKCLEDEDEGNMSYSPDEVHQKEQQQQNQNRCVADLTFVFNWGVPTCHDNFTAVKFVGRDDHLPFVPNSSPTLPTTDPTQNNKLVLPFAPADASGEGKFNFKEVFLLSGGNRHTQGIDGYGLKAWRIVLNPADHVIENAPTTGKTDSAASSSSTSETNTSSDNSNKKKTYSLQLMKYPKNIHEKMVSKSETPENEYAFWSADLRRSDGMICLTHYHARAEFLFLDLKRDLVGYSPPLDGVTHHRYPICTFVGADKEIAAFASRDGGTVFFLKQEKGSGGSSSSSSAAAASSSSLAASSFPALSSSTTEKEQETLGFEIVSQIKCYDKEIYDLSTAPGLVCVGGYQADLKQMVIAHTPFIKSRFQRQRPVFQMAEFCGLEKMKSALDIWRVKHMIANFL